jgi:phosphatidate cytidylyltransferase
MASKQNSSGKTSRISSRVLTALVGMPIVAAIVWAGGSLLWAITFLLAMIGLRELDNAIQSTLKPHRLVGVIAYPILAAVFAVVWQAAKPSSTPEVSGWLLALIIALPWLLSVAAVWRYSSHKPLSLVSIALTVLAVFYVALFAFLPLLRAQGQVWMWLLLLAVWASDIGAYYAGRAFGRRKLTPLSPGKTREGALAGVAAALVTSTLMGAFSSVGLLNGFCAGLLIGFTAPLGDLVESFWKRELGVKDLGTLLPGHGGVLDRCDSLIFSAPLIYLLASLNGKQ